MEKKEIAHSGVAGSGATVALVWFWNQFVPAHPMPAEVAAAVVPMIGGCVAWLVNAVVGREKES